MVVAEIDLPGVASMADIVLCVISLRLYPDHLPNNHRLCMCNMPSVTHTKTSALQASFTTVFDTLVFHSAET